MRTLLRVILSTLCLINIGSINLAQQDLKISKIEFEGLQRLSAEEVTATAGLKTGDRFDVTALDAAAQRLADSGLFKSVAYHTKADRDLITITFQVEEVKASDSRVVFDNFIWFSDSELIAAVKRDVPSFNGSAPDNGDIVERITKSLQRFLHEHQIEATVNYMASQDAPTSASQDHVFSVTGVPMPICSIHFPGANNIPETTLLESSKPLVGSDYSNKFVSLFASNSLIPLYRQHGQLKAVFAPPTAKPEASATCHSGVDLTLAVDEGPVYKWEKAEWTGNSALTTTSLDGALGMRPGDIADGVKIERATREISKAYGAKGYLMAHWQTHPILDDAAQKVTYKFVITEGPQFHMGKVFTKGLSVIDAKALTDGWELKPGSVYDEEYATEFSRKQIGALLRNLFAQRRAEGKPVANVRLLKNLNKDNATVDVTFELSN